MAKAVKKTIKRSYVKGGRAKPKLSSPVEVRSKEEIQRAKRKAAREGALYVRLKLVNRTFVSRQSKKHGLSERAYLDEILDQVRNDCKKATG